MRARAAIANAAGQAFEISEIELDEPRAGEVLVEIAGVGICHTDVVGRDGGMPLSLPAVFGHEGAGRVIATGPGVTRLVPGDAVVLSYRQCGHCRRCAAGDPAYCHKWGALNVSGARADGSPTIRRAGKPVAASFFGQSSFATHAIAHVDNAVKVGDDLPLALLGPLGCGFQTGAGAVIKALACRLGEALLVTGGGPVGLAAVMAAAALGLSPIILVEPVAARRRLALELGASHAIAPDDDLPGVVRAISAFGVDAALDTTGLEPVIAASLACIGPHGRLGLVGIPRSAEAALTLPLMPLLGLGQTVRGIIEGDADPHRFIPEILALHRTGCFPFDRLIRTYPFAAINEAIAAQTAGECVKAVLTFD
ncbi:MAG TPA: NAD(P)-dependent alcohol dehydrogenase [Sphingobium sp.]|uniref:NAD(P)-dependent alcohol dehydrogenase n=1 Tax=Sphingobium sp. TaxID=1912891 RepID=UPI002ED2CEDB